MGFTRVRYESAELGNISIEVDDDILGVIGTPPTAVADSSLTAYTSGSRLRNGCHARGVQLTRERGTAPDTFTSSRFLPIVTIADAALPAFAPGASITIDGTAWEVARAVDEVIR